MNEKKILLEMKKHERLVFGIFLLSIFLFRIPNFYPLLIIKQSLLTTQALARMGFVLVFAWLVFLSFIEKKSLIGKKLSIESILVVVFFLWQTMSVVVVENPTAFLNRYKDILVSYLVFWLAYYYRSKIRTILETVSLAVFINLVYQTIMFWWRSGFERFVAPLIYEKHLGFVMLNMTRERIYMDVYDEAFLLAFLYILRNKISKKVMVLGVFGVVFFSLVSNFRSRVLMLLVVGLGWMMAEWRTKLFSRKLLGWLGVMMGIAYLVNVLMFRMVGFSFVDRLALRHKEEDVTSLNSRWDQIEYGFGMTGQSVFGVGLGNYFDNLPASKDFKAFRSGLYDVGYKGYMEYVHNNIASVAAESGWVGLVLFLILISVFAWKDWKVMAGNNYGLKSVVVAFWVLFSYGLFNPTVPGSYQVLFWLVRGMLI